MYPSRQQALELRIEDLFNRLDTLNNYTDEEFEYWSMGMREVHYSDEELVSVRVEEIFFASDVQRAIELALYEIDSIKAAAREESDDENHEEDDIQMQHIPHNTYRFLPDEDREIGKYYIITKDIYRTAEKFNVDTARVRAIVDYLIRKSKFPHFSRKPLRDYLE